MFQVVTQKVPGEAFGIWGYGHVSYGWLPVGGRADLERIEACSRPCTAS